MKIKVFIHIFYSKKEAEFAANIVRIKNYPILKKGQV